jgi:hypothetical protein
MRLIGQDGYGLELRIAGYQFPNAEDESLRTSWLMIAGTAYSPEGTWSFRWQALTPPDARYLGTWLRTAEPGDALSFTEPNLSFAVLERTPPHTVLRMGLDLEFSPPWRKHIGAGDPYLIQIRLPTTDLLTAAEAWSSESAHFPG